MRGTLAERFWSKVDKRNKGECWLWLGFPAKGGYGQLRTSSGRYRMATAVSLFIETGKMPPPLTTICHRCDNPPCVNPAHLFLGTQKTNMVDCSNKGRIGHGDNHCHAKLTAADVNEIRVAWRNGAKSAELASVFSINRQEISRIMRGRTWVSRETKR